jgi:hypothetical protein
LKEDDNDDDDDDKTILKLGRMKQKRKKGNKGRNARKKQTKRVTYFSSGCLAFIFTICKSKLIILMKINRIFPCNV